MTNFKNVMSHVYHVMAQIIMIVYLAMGGLILRQNILIIGA
jgi:hypothetical protein